MSSAKSVSEMGEVSGAFTEMRVRPIKKRKKKKSTNKLRGEGIILLFFSTKDSQRKEALGM
jgi:hypothetical protein